MIKLPITNPFRKVRRSEEEYGLERKDHYLMARHRLSKEDQGCHRPRVVCAMPQSNAIRATLINIIVLITLLGEKSEEE